MAAKTELFDRIKYLDHAVSLPQVMDDGIQLTDHNGAANLIRKGLAIVAFNILEDFIKNKTIETLDFISDTGVSFDLLPEKLQKAAVLDVLSSLSFRANIERKIGNDWKRLIQDEAIKIQSTANANYQLSKYSLLSGNSNIDKDEVSTLLGCFGIKGGWRTIKKVSDDISGGLLDLSQSYQNAASRRHAAAHSAEFRYEYNWLSSLKDEIISIAASIDILLTARCRQVSGNLTTNLDDLVIDNDLNYLFLELQGSKYKQTRTIGGRSSKNWAVLANATNMLKPTLSRKKEFLIVLDSQRRICDWCS